MLYIFEMANNHMGSVDHAKRIVDEFADLAQKKGINAGIKCNFETFQLLFIQIFNKGMI